MRTRAEYNFALDWAQRCFGWEHVGNRKERALRLVEEAIELCQAVDVDADKVQEVVKSVYSRPHGDPVQEMGGVLLTAYVMSLSVLRWDPDEIFLRELMRVLSKPAAEFKARNDEKISLPA